MGLGLSGLRLGLGQRGGGGIVPNIYVDSIAGSDSNNGLTAATAFKTLAAAEAAAEAKLTGAVIGLKRGGRWLGQTLNISVDVTDSRIIAYGDETDPLPLIDGAATASNASFSKTGGYTNIYQISWTHSNTRPNANFTAWESDQPLQWAADLATLDATPGSYYYSGAVNTSPLVIYIHPFGSTAPTSDAKKYEITNVSNPVVFWGDRNRVSGVHARRHAQNDGCIVMYGADSEISGCLMTHGNRHHGYVNAMGGAVRNSVAFITNRQVTADWTMFVAYADVDGGSATFDNVYARSYAEDVSVGLSGDGIGTGIYAHTNGGGNRITSISITGAHVFGCIYGIGAGDTDALTVSQGWIEQCRRSLSGGDVQLFSDVQAYASNTYMGSNVSQFVYSGGATSATLTDIVAGIAGQANHFAFSAGSTVSMQRVYAMDGKLLPNNGTLTDVEISDSIIGYGQDLEYAQVSASSGNVYKNVPTRNFNDGVSSYATLALYKAAQPSLEANSVEAASFPLQTDILAARSIDGEIPAEATTGGRDCVPRVTVVAPDWETLMISWDHGYLGFDGPKPGAEIIPDPTFDTTTEWANFGWTITGNGEASLATVSGFDSFRDDVPITDGAKVVVEVVVSDYTSGSVYVRVGTGNPGRVYFNGSPTVSKAGVYRAVHTHPAGDALQVSVQAQAGFTGTIAKVSVREVA